MYTFRNQNATSRKYVKFIQEVDLLKWRTFVQHDNDMGMLENVLENVDFENHGGKKI